MEILEESVFRTMKCLGANNFDWMICHNGMTPDQMSYLEYIVQGRPIELVEQSWSDCPIPDHQWSPIIDGKVIVDGQKAGGTLWKVCPARVDINRHEIVMDNDIVLLTRPRQFDEFLSVDTHTLVLEEPIRFYGRYNDIVPSGEKLNSGLMGFPPGYNFGEEILANWERHGALTYLSQADEQGLLMYTITRGLNIRIYKHEIKELLAKANPEPWDRGANGFHFVQANRTVTGHRSWIDYQEKYKNSIFFV